MIARKFTVWQKLTALAPMLLLVVALPGQELLRCQMDGLLRPACCCPADQGTQNDTQGEAQSDSATAVVNAQGCCDRTSIAGDHPPAEATRTGLAEDELGWTSFQALPSPVAFSLAAPNRGVRFWQSHAPPRDGPSVVLLKHAFLI